MENELDSVVKRARMAAVMESFMFNVTICNRIYDKWKVKKRLLF